MGFEGSLRCRVRTRFMSSWWIISPVTEMGNGELKRVNSFWDAVTLREPQMSGHMSLV